ncbi:MAG: hypothetical protein ABI598_02240 [Chloroflexota bacterium]
MTFTGTRFLAVTSNEPATGLLLESTDGRSWDRMTPLETDGWTIGPALLATDRQGVIAIGGGNGGPIAVWRAEDGRSWARVADQDAFQMRDRAFEGIEAVIPMEGGWLAVGGGQYNDTGPALVRAIVLTSPDGLYWTREADRAAFTHAVMKGIVRTTAGYAAVGAVIGSSAAGVSELHAALWTSLDGLDWSLSTTPPAFDLPTSTGRTDVILDGITVIGDRMVVVGHVDRYDVGESSPRESMAITWWSDGGTWTPVQIGPYNDVGPLSIIATPGGFLVLGAAIDARCAGGAWASPDGTSWRCFASETLFDGFEITGFAASPDREVLVGTGNTPGTDGVSATWTLARH